MARAKPVVEIAPSSFLSRAREFQAVSEKVFDGQNSLNMPLYFLYLHTLELTFKAFLRYHNVPTADLKDKKRGGHRITLLFENCKQFGLVITPWDQTNIANVVNLLERANKNEGLRYFNPELSGMPSLAWTREVVQELLQIVGGLIEPTPMSPGPATRLVFIFGKPS
jgi:hypothetical protein